MRTRLAEPIKGYGALRSVRTPAHAVGVREQERETRRREERGRGELLGWGRWGEGPPASLIPTERSGCG